MDSANNKLGDYRGVLSTIGGALFGLSIILISFFAIKLIEGFIDAGLLVEVTDQIKELPSSWVGGFLSGVIATLVGFILTMLWDILKSYRDRVRRDNTLLTSAKHELLIAIDSLKNNKDVLEDEIKSLKNNKFIIIPLAPIYGDVWGLFKLHLPRKIAKSPKLLMSARDVSYAVEHLNEISRSRENYRLSNMNMSNHNSVLKIYDDILLNGIKNVTPEIEALEKQL